ncbi:MAG: TraR/DksA C4-type zinc finger protein [Candidatus Uhrbacteria bacterium]|nr:TraR/DksA C4-type zinc finger protein [Candidatus Uhrbacteria bacterium]
MENTFLNEIKGLLEAEKAKIELELSRFAHRNTQAVDTDFDSDFPSFGDDEDENANEVAAYSNNLSLEDELEKVLRDVNDSLRKIDDASYGTCKYCQAEIAEARLRARPTSTSCIACKKTLTQEV